MPLKKKIKIGFLGMGTVAQGVWKHLDKNRREMSSRFGIDYELSRVGVRDLSKKRDVKIPPSKMTGDLYEVVNDPSIDIVCELMGGTGLAFEMTIAALKRGKIVVSANKAVICERGAEIFETARKFGGAYFFEASVAGGIPVIKILREGLVANRFPLIYGILNGTCNYILTRMERENASFETILSDARRLGYVEADESLDIDGFDAAHKISILTYLAHGAWVRTKDMLISGIRGIQLEDMLFARDFDCKIKLIASVRKNEKTNAIFASVYPALLPLTDVVANVTEVYNAVSLTGDVVGHTVYIGRGAGQDATASAVIADIADAIRYKQGAPMRPPASELGSDVRLAHLDEISARFYLRLEVKDAAGVLAKIAAILARQNISIALLRQYKHETPGRAWLVLTTHETTESDIKNACAELKKSSVVKGSAFVLRIFSSVK